MSAATEGFAHPEYLIETEELAARLGDRNLMVLDSTTHLIPDPKITYEVKPGREEAPSSLRCEQLRAPRGSSSGLTFAPVRLPLAGPASVAPLPARRRIRHLGSGTARRPPDPEA